MNKVARRTIAATALLATCVVAAGCQQATSPAATKTAADVKAAALKPISVTVAPVAVREVQQHVSVVGTLYGLEDITITPKVEGRIERIYHDIGDRVAPGAVLLEIDATDYKLAEAEARRALESQLAQLGLTEPPPKNFSVEQLPSIERARLQVEYAKRHLERTKSLLERMAASQEDYDRALTDEQVARASLAQVKLEAEATLAAVQHRQAVLATAQQRLADAVVRAPTLPGGAGNADSTMQFVIAQRLVSEGEMVRAFPSAPVFEVVLDDLLKLRARVPERYTSQVVVGQSVAVSVEAYPGESFPATVTRINPTIDPDSRTFEIEAQVKNTDHRLRHGGFAKADIIVREEAQAATIPITALVRFAGVNKVFVVDNERAREVAIQVTHRRVDWLEVTGPLQPGDRVVTSGHGQLYDGAAVVIRSDTSATADQTTSTDSTVKP